MTQQQIYYYEVIHGEVYLLVAGSIQSFRSVSQMHSFVSDPSALFIEVTQENWETLNEAGVFEHD